MANYISLDEIIERTSDLPTIDAIALKVMRECERPEATANSIARILGQDAALTSRVLRLANSAYYGLSRKVGGLQEAVVVLGIRCVKNLSLVASTYPWLCKPLDGYGLEPKDMWKHSHGTGLGAQIVANASGRVRDDMAFTGGLLHDIGKLALSTWLERKSFQMAELAELKGWTFIQAERNILGYDQCQVGFKLAERWNLPDELAYAAGYHHDPSQMRDESLIVDAVHIGNFLAMSLGYGLGIDGLRYEVHEESLRRLGLKPEDLPAITEMLAKEFERSEQTFRGVAA